MDRRKTMIDLGVYLLLVIGISILFYVLIIGGGGFAGSNTRRYATGLMWTPGLAALLTVWLRRIDLRSLGWGWGEWKWNTAGYLIPLFYILAAYILIWTTGAGGFADQANVDKIAESMGWQGMDNALVLIFFFLLLAFTGTITSVSSALGEEIGWRGFLTPRLVALSSFTTGSIITGLIWALWHFPLIVAADYNGGTPWWYSTLCFAIMILGMSVILTWLRLKSGSLWPATLFHTTHNMFLQIYFQGITGERGDATKYAGGEFGWALPLMTTIVAIYFWTRRGETATQAASAHIGRAATDPQQ
ncbi:CPBP family intramembrane glutamic endopeptidase [Sphingosinicella rhizophila]|uniref:Type II CAAX endopeptidase family protein n=1 Tax=Sphingosinicella rhizophila TaxID=3050082 RepID=A0ABU3Q3X8_9SPHN|nr:type II CAAX endopeptidase family protein [Sphingosinicella sp. GR2756]MDT9598133.1 type II CAAX endopeptidase family protein [Sphingosinicella sp. GR2756]